MRLFTTSLALLLASAPTLHADDEIAPPRVELAICLDTSGSMDGLIDAARQKLWTIVNDLATATPTPELRVALLTFGNDGHDAAAGWVKVDSPFTTDLDLISQALFALKTNGGTEFVGRVLDSASRLEWTKGSPGARGPETLKIAIVAGNESAEQDTEVRFQDVCPRLIADGVIVNSVYCGPETDEFAPAWRQVGRLADGHFATIDHNTGTIVVETPFDEALGRLSASVNKTYLWFGTAGAVAGENQIAQDLNAFTLNSAAVAARAKTKGGGLYNNGADLVHACSTGIVDLADVKDEDLPEEMRAQTPDERKAYLAKKEAERKEIETEIAELSKKRDEYVAKEMERLALADSDSFDNAVRMAIREQASSKGFAFAD